MRILWVSVPGWCSTGYGNQTGIMVPRLQQIGHDVGIYAFYGLEGSILEIEGLPVYPRGDYYLGQDVRDHAEHFHADIVITLYDIQPIQPEIFTPHVTWCPWFPVDHEPLPPLIREKLRLSKVPIAYSRFGERMCLEAGIENILYVPHGIDRSVFYPVEKCEARSSLGLSPDKFLISMVAANSGFPSRKCLPQCLMAFSEFRKFHPEALLYLHTLRGLGHEHQGVNLVELISFLSLEESVSFSDPYTTRFGGFPSDYLRNLYCASDVVLSPSMGEGFGIPILEAQACGTPVITGDWTSMSELTFAGWKIPKREAEPWWDTWAASQTFLPHIGAIREMLEEAYIHRHDPTLKACAIEGAAMYDADLVASQYWKPVLEGPPFS